MKLVLVFISGMVLGAVLTVEGLRIYGAQPRRVAQASAPHEASPTFVEGTYVAVGDPAFPASIEFRDGRAKLLFAWLEYRLGKNALYIRDPEKGDLRCEISGSDRIDCPPYGVYQRR